MNTAIKETRVFSSFRWVSLAWRVDAEVECCCLFGRVAAGIKSGSILVPTRFRFLPLTLTTGTNVILRPTRAR